MTYLSNWLAKLSSAIGALALIGMTSMVIVDVLMRTLFQQSLGFVEEITGYLVALVTVFGVAITFRECAMFRVSFLYDRLPHGLQRLLGTIFLAVSIVFCALMVRYTSLLVWSSFERGKIAATDLQTPIYIPQIALPAGFLVLLIFAIDRLLKGGTIRDDSHEPMGDSHAD